MTFPKLLSKYKYTDGFWKQNEKICKESLLIAYTISTEKKYLQNKTE